MATWLFLEKENLLLCLDAARKFVIERGMGGGKYVLKYGRTHELLSEKSIILDSFKKEELEKVVKKIGEELEKKGKLIKIGSMFY